VDHRWIVAAEFRVFGFVLGLPALAVLINLGWDWWNLRGAPPPPPAQHLEIQKYGLVALLSDGAQGLGAMLGFLGTLASFAAALIGIVAALALLFGMLLYFTGSGIGHHKTWARVVAILVTVVCLLTWIGLLFNAQQGVVAVAALGTVLALYTLWVLGWKFA
jgi:hypothetical protein